MIRPAASEKETERTANELFVASRPRTRHGHWQGGEEGGYLFLSNGSRFFEVDVEVIARLDEAAARGDRAVELLLDELALGAARLIDDTPLQSPPLRAVSLAIAQKCNLACSYCYADHGKFGGTARAMGLDTALRAVDLLIGNAPAGSRVNLSFLGGEPLANRVVLRAVTEYAAREAAARGVVATYSITTNGTLLTEQDGAFFEHYGFAVTVSLDGLREAHDSRRPFHHGGGSFEHIIARVQPLLAMQRKMQVSVRATITPGNYRLLESLEYFFAMGFHSAGFSPLLRSPNGQGEMKAHELHKMLQAMVECGAEFERCVTRGRRFAFSNMMNAMRELHRGTHRPYPCGAGAGYLGVSAEGLLSACHRFVGDKDGAMGDLDIGVDRELQNRWLRERHVDRQKPCNSCWARYLCGGGCHHEVIAQGHTACDYIRGWLYYCLQVYSRLSLARPDWFDGVA